MANCYFTRACVWFVACSLLAGASDLFGQSPGNRKNDEAAVRQTGKDCLAAIQRGDSKAIADFWTVDGTFTDSFGRSIKVRDLLARDDGGPSILGIRPAPTNVTVRFVAEAVAMETGEFRFPPAAGEGAVTGRYTALWVRQNGQWKLDSVQESSTAPVRHPDQLASLGAFEGEWLGEQNKVAIHVSAKWDTNKKFMSRRVAVSSGKSSLIGTQTIGWDPLSQRVRSWMFSDDGSYSEGLWSLEGNAWMVLSTRVLPDGKVSEATQVYKFPDKNTMVWKLLRGTIDGQPTDDLEVVLKRSVAD